MISMAVLLLSLAIASACHADQTSVSLSANIGNANSSSAAAPPDNNSTTATDNNTSAPDNNSASSHDDDDTSSPAPNKEQDESSSPQDDTGTPSSSGPIVFIQGPSVGGGLTQSAGDVVGPTVAAPQQAPLPSTEIEAVKSTTPEPVDISEPEISEPEFFFEPIILDVDLDGRLDSITIDYSLAIENEGMAVIQMRDDQDVLHDESAFRLLDTNGDAFFDFVSSIDVTDWDLDGDKDLVLISEGIRRILLNDGTGIFQEHVENGD
jgi:hypothetical protein